MTLKRYTKLKATKSLNRKSIRKVKEENNEVEDRIALCKRANGTPEVLVKLIPLDNNTEIENRTVQCHDGICELCGKFGNLEPHEEGLRSRGFKVSLKNSKMVCRECHNDRGSNPQWTKNE